MLRSLPMMLVVCFTVSAGAQVVITPQRSGMQFPSPVAVGDSIARLPLFLHAGQEFIVIESSQRAPLTPARDCPMPVHRPDTSRLERMGVAAPPTGVDYSMPRAALDCLNPLDQRK